MAALTIPGLVVKNQEKETVVQLKKVYGALNNAFYLAKIDYGSPIEWKLKNAYRSAGAGQAYTPEGGVDLAEIFANYLNIAKNCGSSYGCWANTTKDLKGNFVYNGVGPLGLPGAYMILADSTNVHFRVESISCESYNNVCAQIEVDTNGMKKPNVRGKDTFSFWLTKDGIVPMGGPNDPAVSLKNRCKGGDGVACTAWIILNDNMDFPPYGKGWD